MGMAVGSNSTWMVLRRGLHPQGRRSTLARHEPVDHYIAANLVVGCHLDGELDRRTHSGLCGDVLDAHPADRILLLKQFQRDIGVAVGALKDRDAFCGQATPSSANATMPRAVSM